MPFLRTDAGEGAGCVDQGDDGKAELGREPHDSQRFAVALGVGTTEISKNIFLRVAPLLVRHHRNGTSVDFGQPAGHRRIVTEEAVAVQLGEVFKAQPKVIKGKWSCRVAGDLHPLPGGKVLVDFPFQGTDLFLDLADLRVDP